jgi:DNA-binding NarL/FixJ family response regulator
VTGDPIRVLVADDHPALRRSVRVALEREGFEIAGETDTAAATIETALRERPDVCLLDIHMPGSGIAAAAEISFRLPDTAVVILTVSRNDNDLFDALRAGAAGYLLKDMDPARLANALRGVLAGEAALPRALVARVIEEFRQRGRRRLLPLLGERGVELTSREWEILELLRTGCTTAEIAERLFVSKVTVRRHVSSILRKLRVADRKAALQLLEERSDN